MIGIPALLSAIGLSPSRSDSNGVYYRSPWSMHGDQHPSLQISCDGRAFHDWASGESGDIIDIARKLGGIDTVPGALRYIQSLIGIPEPEGKVITPADKKRKQPGISIESVVPISSPQLVGYAWQRGIGRNILTEYCREVRYHLAVSPKKSYYAIGWQNDSGGYELRNPFVKQAVAPKDITTVGDVGACTCLVLEGFFDFLSAVALGLYDPARMNAIVLNSTALTQRAICALREMAPTQVICLLDHDESGRKSTAMIHAALPVVTDSSSFYPQDLNDYLVATRHQTNA